MIVLEIAAGIVLAAIVLRYFGIILFAASGLIVVCIALALIAGIVAFVSSSNEALYLTIGLIAFAVFCWWTHDPRWHTKESKK